MKRSGNFKALARAVGAIGAVIIIVSGVTFAALQSQQAKLTGNTIETATANLQISSDAVNYSSALAGFDFANLVPGAQPVPQNGNTIFLKNSGATPLALKFAISSAPTNPNSVDLSKVNAIVTAPSSNGAQQTFNFQSLITANTIGGVAINSPAVLMPGQTVQLILQVSMNGDAVSGPSASLANIDFAFSGQALSN